MDKAKLMEMPTREVEMPRLSELTGEPFEVTCKVIDGERYADIQRSAIDLNKKGGLRNINLYEMQVMYLLFKYKNMKPSEFYWLPLGEKKILGCFIKRELEERQEERQEEMKQLYGDDAS